MHPNQRRLKKSLQENFALKQKLLPVLYTDISYIIEILSIDIKNIYNILDEFELMKENNVDPLRECLHVFDHLSSSPDIEKNIKGLIIFVHGSPCEGKRHFSSMNVLLSY